MKTSPFGSTATADGEFSKAAEAGAKAILCASTGNTSASAAAYAARAGMRCVVLLPHGKIAMGKLAQENMT